MFYYVRSTNCPQARLSIPCICHVLKVASNVLTTFKTTAGISSDSQAAKSSPEHQQHPSSDCQHGSSRSPTQDMKGKRKISSMHAVASSLSPTAGQPLPANVMREHAFIAQIALNIVGARFPTQVIIFKEFAT